MHVWLIATSGLYLACKILNLKKNDWVWTSSNTFISTASIIEHANGNVDLLDVNEDGNLSIEYLKKNSKKQKSHICSRQLSQSILLDFLQI